MQYSAAVEGDVFQPAVPHEQQQFLQYADGSTVSRDQPNFYPESQDGEFTTQTTLQHPFIPHDAIQQLQPGAQAFDATAFIPTTVPDEYIVPAGHSDYAQTSYDAEQQIPFGQSDVAPSYPASVTHSATELQPYQSLPALAYPASGECYPKLP